MTNGLIFNVCASAKRKIDTSLIVCIMQELRAEDKFYNKVVQIISN